MARKSQGSRPTMVRLPGNVRRELERAAELHQRSLSAEVIYRLEQSLLSPEKRPSAEEQMHKELREVREELSELRADLRDVRQDLSHMLPEREQPSFNISATKDEDK